MSLPLRERLHELVFVSSSFLFFAEGRKEIGTARGALRKTGRAAKVARLCCVSGRGVRSICTVVARGRSCSGLLLKINFPREGDAKPFPSEVTKISSFERAILSCFKLTFRGADLPPPDANQLLNSLKILAYPWVRRRNH